MHRPIYLDHNATTPILPEVADAMRACWLEPTLNPASQHVFGRQARRLLDDCRERIGELLGAAPTDRILFTSGGTEANNLALRGLLGVPASEGTLAPDPHRARAHLLASPIEHPSIASLAARLRDEGLDVEYLPVSREGVLQADALADLLRPSTCLCTAMLANNETGVVQPIGELAAICQAHRVPLHCDAVQAVGKVSVDFRRLGVTTMSVAAHKFHGPLGIGVLAVREGIELSPLLYGGVQQQAVRPGTEAVPLVVGMCRALEIWHSEAAERALRLQNLRDKFERLILDGYPEARVIGARAERLPHTSLIAFRGLDRQALFIALDQAGVACSAGSACASGSSEPSPALLAMGAPKAVFTSALRFSFGATTTSAEVDEASARILRCCKNFRQRN